jgi:hypothetical protein
MTFPIIAPIVDPNPRPLPSGPSNKRRSCLDDVPPPNSPPNAPNHARECNVAAASNPKAKKNCDKKLIYPASLMTATHAAKVAQCDENEVIDETGIENMLMQVRI